MLLVLKRNKKIPILPRRFQIQLIQSKHFSFLLHYFQVSYYLYNSSGDNFHNRFSLIPLLSCNRKREPFLLLQVQLCDSIKKIYFYFSIE